MSAPPAHDWLHGQLRAARFLERYPYYAAVLARLSVVHDPTVRWLAVSFERGRYYLHCNASTFVDNMDYLPGIVLHELHHVVLGHLASESLRAAADAELMELAMEMSANEYVREPLPDPIVVSAFAAVGVRAGQSTMQRYRLLVDARAAGREVRPRPDGTIDDHRPWSEHAVEGGALEQTRRLVADAVESVRAKSPDAPMPASAPQWQLAGREPGRVLEALTARPQRAERPLEWPALLRRFVARRRAPAASYARPSRRFPERLGVIPGRSYALRTTQRPHLLVVLDTSMSVPAGTLYEWSRQLVALADFARFTVLECDTEVTRSYAFEGALTQVQGRGGTDLRPPFAPEVLAAHRPEGLVYFTDGRGPYPERPPPVPVLWVLTADHAFDCPWGERAVP